jgi:hypothetical protein
MKKQKLKKLERLAQAKRRPRALLYCSDNSPLHTVLPGIPGLDRKNDSHCPKPEEGENHDAGENSDWSAAKLGSEVVVHDLKELEYFPSIASEMKYR